MSNMHANFFCESFVRNCDVNPITTISKIYKNCECLPA